ncbi:MAG: response regulator, partial [Panacibacter sp.]
MKPAILLVEDNQEMIEFIADDLNETYHVIKAGNGREALERLQEEAIQLVISDVMMDVMDGFELCKNLKA